MINDAINIISAGIANKLDNLMIEGLKIKGFEFENKFELEKFIKNNCRCEDQVEIKERTYFVNDIPFFLHKYDIEMSNPITEGGVFKIIANYGHYAYL